MKKIISLALACFLGLSSFAFANVESFAEQENYGMESVGVEVLEDEKASIRPFGATNDVYKLIKSSTGRRYTSWYKDLSRGVLPGDPYVANSYSYTVGPTTSIEGSPIQVGGALTVNLASYPRTNNSSKINYWSSYITWQEYYVEYGVYTTMGNKIRTASGIERVAVASSEGWKY